MAAACGVVTFLCSCSGEAPEPTLPDAVTLTWLSVTNWLIEAGDTRILMDGYVGRVDRATVDQDGGSSAPARPDSGTVRLVQDVAFPDGGLDLILVGHTHWDHGFDAPAWAALTGARIVGARTACLQARAFGIDDCTGVEGGETIDAGPVHIRVVRWHHSGDSTTASGRRLRAPLELREAPTPDPATGGLQPGYLRDYPNGGGSRAYLVTIATTGGPVTLFWSNTGNAQAWDAPIPADSAWFRAQGIDTDHLGWAPGGRPTRDELAEALRAEGIDDVDAWLGFPGTEHMRQVLPLLRPRAFLPHHWDDFWLPLAEGSGRPPDPVALRPALETTATRPVVPQQVFDRFRIKPTGVEALGPGDLRERFLEAVGRGGAGG